MKRLRLAIAVLLLVGVCYFVGPTELLSALANLSLETILLLVLLSILLVWISCVKWRMFLREGGSDASILHLMELYTIGYFFNLFTPSFVGGDVIRSYKLGAAIGDQKQAFVSTFLERFTGLLAMTTLGLICVLSGTEVTRGLEYAVYLVSFAAFVLAGICFSEPISLVAFYTVKFLARSIPIVSGERVEQLLNKLHSAFEHARGKPSLLFRSLALSFVFHILTIANTYVAAVAVGWDRPPVGGLFVVVPLALLVGMVPLTPSGLGIQEGAFLYLLKRIGATEGVGLGVGIILRAKAIVLGLFGGILYLSYSSRKRSVHAK